LIESSIERLPGVRACALVGLPDPVSGDERLVLAVEPERQSDRVRLIRRLRAALDGLDPAYRPDQILLFALPRAGRSGKIDRAALQTLARQRLAC
jgi:acyl-coenzyme A synthetase/AMP-(fatty) acid ligase